MELCSHLKFNSLPVSSDFDLCKQFEARYDPTKTGTSSEIQILVVANTSFTILQVLLHLWVMIVLLTYQPEIHGPDTLKMPAAP